MFINNLLKFFINSKLKKIFKYHILNKNIIINEINLQIRNKKYKSSRSSAA